MCWPSNATRRRTRVQIPVDPAAIPLPSPHLQRRIDHPSYSYSTQGKRPSRPDPAGSDPRVAQLEAKLEELKTLGDRIKERAVSALRFRVLLQ